MTPNTAEFYHPKPERFAAVCRRFFPYVSHDYPLAQREIPIPALLSYTGFPLAENQFCFRHKGHGRSLSCFMHDNGYWFFKCCDPQCGIRGDVVQMWWLMVKLSGFAPPGWNWNRTHACGDLLARVKRGMIDVSISEFENGRLNSKYPPPPKDIWRSKLEDLIKNRPPVTLRQGVALPRQVRISVKEAILGLFPLDGYLLITPRVGWQQFNIYKRDRWLAHYPEVLKCSFISSNYLSRDDVQCSRLGMEGVERRWLVIEGDEGTLEQQLWIHKELEAQYQNLGCVLYSGGKSLHGWYDVENWTAEQCFRLYAEAIDLGIRDCSTWRMSQPVRMPQGLRRDTKRKQAVLVWNL